MVIDMVYGGLISILKLKLYKLWIKIHLEIQDVLLELKLDIIKQINHLF